MTEHYKKHQKSVMMKLDEIIRQNNYIIQLVEAVADDANLVTYLRGRLTATSKAMRELEYERWFEQNKKESHE